MCHFSPVFRQFLTIICCNLLAFVFGASTGWATINFNEFQSENTTLPTGPLTAEQSILLVSIPYAGCFIGNFAIVPLSRAIGIKRTIHLFGIPAILSTLLIIWAKDVYWLYVSRFLSGSVGGAVSVAVPSFVNEISFDNVRGALNSLYDPSNNTGMVVSFFLGNFLDCIDQAKVQLIIPIIFMIILFLFPDSPEYWIKKNKKLRASKSRKFYRGDIIDPENGEFSSNTSKVNKNYADENTSWFEKCVTVFKSFGTPHAKKAFAISYTAIVLGFLCCTSTILVYVTDIFSKTGSPISEKSSSILVSVVTLVGNLVFFSIVERFNRKTLHFGSAILTAMSFFLFSAYCLFWLKQPEYEWIPPFCLVCIIFFSCLGLFLIPYIIAIEIFPREILEISIAIAVSFIWIVMFIIGTIFPFVLNAVGLPACMFILGIMCIVNAVYGIFFIPETRGKSYEDIQALLVG